MAKQFWIHKQADLNIAQFDTAMEENYPDSVSYVRDPKKHIQRICEECNYLNSVEKVDWNKYLIPGCNVLEMGCGGGWLTGYLSKFKSVKTIYALDSSRHYLSGMMPEVVKLMSGNIKKIHPIEGFFTPLLMKDGTIDVVVASSALHHADNLEDVLREIRRVLKKDGLLFILNEVPYSKLGYLYLLLKFIVKVFVQISIQDYKAVSPSVSSSGLLSNPFLGDRDYPLWYWKEALTRSSFDLIEFIDTGLPTIKNTRGHSLKHFICKRI